MASLSESASNDENQLQDGFQELFTFRCHRLQLRGFGLVEGLHDSSRPVEYYSQQFYISWDVKQVVLWKYDVSDIHQHPKVVNQVKFSHQPNFICAIVYAPKLKVFLAAALDMSFKIFDRSLSLLESIQHEERAILQLEYDHSKDIIFSSGACGIAAWRLYRNMAADKAHVVEKLYTFDNCETWVSRMIFEQQFNRIYAIKERSVQVLSTTRRTVVTTLENVHEAPVNVVCWYERNQFYLTGCSRGEIKCWTSNYSQKSALRASSPGRGESGDRGSSQQKTFALLHIFKGHTRAVTAIQLHPVSGLAISTGMDGFVKVLNLEALSELFCIHVGGPIVSMRIVKLDSIRFGCMMSLMDASIKLWKITSVCDFFATAAANISRLEIFENMEAELEFHYQLAMRKEIHRRGSELLQLEQIHAYEIKIGAMFGETQSQPRLRATLALENPDAAQTGGTASTAPATAIASSAAAGGEEIPATHESGEEAEDQTPRYIPNMSGYDGGDLKDRILVTYSTQDLRAFTDKGVLLGRMEPEHVVDGIKDFCVSVYQKLLISLCEGDRIRVHDLRRSTFPLIYELNLRNPSSGANAEALNAREENKPNPQDGLIAIATASANAAATGTSVMEDLGLCCELVDVAPGTSLRAPKLSGGGEQSAAPDHADVKFKVNACGHKIPDCIESYLLVGLNNGAIIFLDTLNNFEVQMNFQACNGVVQDMKYRRSQRELLVLGQDFSQTFSTVRIFRLPDMDLVGEVANLRKVSCFSIAPAVNIFGVGLTDGGIRLFTHNSEDGVTREVSRTGEGHESCVASISFCDELRVLCSASTDRKIKFWDYNKRLLRSISLNLPTAAVVANGGPGDVVMTQNHYLLTIPKRIWDEDDVLLHAQQEASLLEAAERAAATLSSLTGAPSPHDPAASPVSGAANDAASSQADDASTMTGTTAPTVAGTSDDSTSRKTSTHERRMSKRMIRLQGAAVAAVTADKRKSVSITTKRRSSNAMRVSLQGSAIPLNLGRGSTVQYQQTQSDKERLQQEVLTQQLEQFEREIIMPSVADKQFQFLSRSEQQQQHQQQQQRRGVIGAGGDLSPSSKKSVDMLKLQQMQFSLVSSAKEEEFPSIHVQESSVREASSVQSGKTHGTQQSEERQAVLDVLHPRYLLHKRPPARLVQLEEVEQHLKNFARKWKRDISGAEAVSSSVDTHSVGPQNQSGEISVDHRRVAQFGLSPRARLTIMYSSPAPDATAAGEHGADRSPHVGRRATMRTSMVDSNLSSFRSSALSMMGAGQTEALNMREHENMVLNMAVGMRVSGQYRKYRESLKETRKLRYDHLKQRATIIAGKNSPQASNLPMGNLPEGADEEEQTESQNDGAPVAPPPDDEEGSLTGGMASGNDSANTSSMQLARRKPVRPMQRQGSGSES